MSTETHLLASALRSRESSDLIQTHLQPAAKNKRDVRYSPEFRILSTKVAEYYQRDTDATSVEQDLIIGLINATVSNDKHKDRFKQLIEEAYAVDTSVSNTNDMILQAKRSEVGDKLAVKLVNREEVDEELAEYNHLHGLVSLDQWLTQDSNVLTGADARGVLHYLSTQQGTFKLRPSRLSEAVEEGLMEGHAIIVLARPEIGKSAFAVTNACGWAMDGKRVLYFINEDPEKLIQLRCISCLSGMTKLEMYENPDKALALAERRGLNNLTIVPLYPGTLAEIEAFIEKWEPHAIIVDQLRNIKVKSENRTGQLEAAAQGIRDLGKKYNLVTLAFTQAGESAEGKAILDMSDTDSSKTGIPSACDLLIGIGATEEHKAGNIRVFSLSKNKVSGWHGSFPTRINPFLSRYMNVE